MTLSEALKISADLQAAAAAVPVVHREPIAEGHRCRVCGCRWGDHRGRDGACPPGRAWGSAEPFPKAARAINASDPATAARAGAAWDLRIARHWARSRGRFEPS